MNKKKKDHFPEEISVNLLHKNCQTASYMGLIHLDTITEVTEYG